MSKEYRAGFTLVEMGGGVGCEEALLWEFWLGQYLPECAAQNTLVENSLSGGLMISSGFSVDLLGSGDAYFPLVPWPWLAEIGSQRTH